MLLEQRERRQDPMMFQELYKYVAHLMPPRLVVSDFARASIVAIMTMFWLFTNQWKSLCSISNSASAVD